MHFDFGGWATIDNFTVIFARDKSHSLLELTSTLLGLFIMYSFFKALRFLATVVFLTNLFVKPNKPMKISSLK